MLKIHVEKNEGEDFIVTNIESNGSLFDVVTELGLAVIKMYGGLKAANEGAAELFRFSIETMFVDPEYWLQELPEELNPDAKMHSVVVNVPNQ